MTLIVTHEIADGDAFLLDDVGDDHHRVLLYDRSAQKVVEIGRPELIQARTPARPFRGDAGPIIKEVTNMLSSSA